MYMHIHMCVHVGTPYHTVTEAAFGHNYEHVRFYVYVNVHKHGYEHNRKQLQRYVVQLFNVVE